MTESVSFEHQPGFEQGELSGQVTLGRFEAHYEEIFAEVIEDGVITLEERARLEKAADALGLDRSRLQRLEDALQAAYEARHHVRIREMADEAPASIVLTPQAAADPRVAALEARVAQLQARVAQLTKELEDARAQVAVEVDVSTMGSAAPADTIDESAEELTRRIRSDPRDAASLHGLYRLYGRANDVDRQWLVANVLTYLDAADDAERATFAQHRQEGLIRPAASLAPESWKLLFHPDEELLTGQIFAVIVPAVLLGRIATLRRDKALPRLDPAAKQDPKLSTVQAVRCFAWAGAILGIGAPPLYLDPEYEGAVDMVPAVPPSTRLGRHALSGRTPHELAFIAGRHLSYYRAEHFIRLLVPGIPDLEDLFLAALSIANAGIPLTAEMKRRVAPIARAIEPVLEPAAIDRLRGHFLRFLEEGGRTNLQRWATAAEKTACRAGLVLANDLRAAHAMLAAEGSAGADTLRPRMDDLIVFLTSDRCNSLRKQLGLTLTA
jgi:polyhydroxyalkanoate synthesis regulator phasin